MNKTTVVSQPTATPTKSVITQINDKISELLNTNNYVLQNFGESLDNRKPTEEEVDRYEQLVSKMKVDPDTIATKDPKRVSLKASGLTREEVVEFQIQAGNSAPD